MGQLIRIDAVRANHAILDLKDDSLRKANMHKSVEIATTRGAILRPIARIKERIEHLERKGLNCHALQASLGDYSAAIEAFEQLCPAAKPDGIGSHKTMSTVKIKGIQSLRDGLQTIESRVAMTERWFSEIRRIEGAAELMKFTISSQEYSDGYQWGWSGFALVGGSEGQIAHVARLIGESLEHLSDGNFTETERQTGACEKYILLVTGTQYDKKPNAASGEHVAAYTHPWPNKASI